MASISACAVASLRISTWLYDRAMIRPAAHDDRADGHLAVFIGAQRLPQRLAHEMGVAVQVDERRFVVQDRQQNAGARGRQAAWRVCGRTIWFPFREWVVRHYRPWTLPHEQIIIAPSLLAGDFSQLGEEARRVEAAGADWLHLDVMDGHFVDNISFGPAVVAAMKKAVKIPLDVHLMISRPDHYPAAFRGGGRAVDQRASRSQARRDRHACARSARRAVWRGWRSTRARRSPPATGIWRNIDLLLVMTVNPGFGGQEFIAATMEKVAAAAKVRAENGWKFHIEVDGGINARHGASWRASTART